MEFYNIKIKGITIDLYIPTAVDLSIYSNVKIIDKIAIDPCFRDKKRAEAIIDSCKTKKPRKNRKIKLSSELCLGSVLSKKGEAINTLKADKLQKVLNEHVPKWQRNGELGGAKVFFNNNIK